jgi:hypothetical protein
MCGCSVTCRWIVLIDSVETPSRKRCSISLDGVRRGCAELPRATSARAGTIAALKAYLPIRAFRAAMNDCTPSTT